MKNVFSYLLLVFISLFCFSLNSKASLIDVSYFLGQRVDDEFSVSGSLTGVIRGYLTVENTSTSNPNFLFVDVCTTGSEPTLWITENLSGFLTASTKWYEVNTPCNVKGQKAKVYRQIMFISTSEYKQSCTIDAKDCLYFESKGQLFSNSTETVLMRLLHLGVSDSIPLDDLNFENGLTQTQILKDILSTLQSSSDRENEAIKEQTEKIQEMIDSDLDASDKELPDNSSFNDYENAEGALIDKVNQADMSNLNIGIDVNASKWIWNTLTSFIESHSAVFAMFISILSIGIIKLALGR